MLGLPGTTAAEIGDALAALGARPWQIEQTAQKIADAFVEAAQAPDTTSDRFVGSIQPIPPGFHGFLD